MCIRDSSWLLYNWFIICIWLDTLHWTYSRKCLINSCKLRNSYIWDCFTDAVFSRLRNTFSNSGLCNKWLYEIFIKNKKLYKGNRNFYWSFANFIWYPHINKQNSRIGFLFYKVFSILSAIWIKE